MDKLLDGIHEFLVVVKVVEIVHLTLLDAPEALHRTVIDTSSHPGHTLLHSLFVQLGLKLLARILEATVTMEQWVRIRILFHGQIEGLKYQLVIVTLTNCKRNNVSTFQIKNCAEIWRILLDAVR